MDFLPPSPDPTRVVCDSETSGEKNSSRMKNQMLFVISFIALNIDVQ